MAEGSAQNLLLSHRGRAEDGAFHTFAGQASELPCTSFSSFVKVEMLIIDTARGTVGVNAILPVKCVVRLQLTVTAEDEAATRTVIIMWVMPRAENKRNNLKLPLGVIGKRQGCGG